MKKAENLHIGSTRDSFLDQEGVRKGDISKVRMAEMMHTSRAQLNRLVDPDQDVTLSTLARAAAIVGRRIRIELA